MVTIAKSENQYNKYSQKRCNAAEKSFLIIWFHYCSFFNDIFIRISLQWTLFVKSKKNKKNVRSFLILFSSFIIKKKEKKKVTQLTHDNKNNKFND